MKHLKHYLIVALLLVSNIAYSQVTNSESFDGTTFVPTGWTMLNISGTSNTWVRATGTVYPSGYGTKSGAGIARFRSWSYSNSVVALVTPAYDLSGRGTSTATVKFWMLRESGYSSASDKIDVYANTSASMTGATFLGTVHRSRTQSPTVGSNGWYQYTFNLPSGFTGATNHIILRATSDYGNDINIDDVTWDSYPPPCSGTPAPGNTVASANPLCSGNSTTLSLQNATTGAGVSYQWQSSTNGTTYSNISGATSSTYNASPTTSTYYRCNVTCASSSSTGTSTPVQVTISSFLSCYCIPSHGTSCGGYGDDLRNVTFGTINNTTGCNNYTDYGGSIAAPNITLGSSQSISASVGPGGTERVGMWIDYDHSGTFDASEFFNIGTAFSGSPVSNTVNIPTTAMTGITKMRVKVRWSTSHTSSSACASYTYGETEDYNINLECPAVTFTTNPSNATTCPGGNATFTAASTTGTGFTTTYKWQVNTGSSWADISNGGIYSNATTATLNITGAPATMSGYKYRCVSSNSCGSSTNSTDATLNFHALPSVTSQPNNSSICPGTGTSFTVGATGAGLTYQWQVNSGGGWTNQGNDAIHSGTNSNTLTIANALLTMNANQYRCIVGGTCTPSATSNGATLTVTNALSITANPMPILVCTGTPGSMTVAATGIGVMYQWEINTGSGWANATNGTVYSGVTTNKITLLNPTLSQNGYQFRCKVTNACGTSLTSSAALLSAITAPTVNTQPSAKVICEGSNTSFSTAATSSGTINYQWQKKPAGIATVWSNVVNSTTYSGAKTNTLTLTNTNSSFNGFQYRCQLNTGCTPSATTNEVLLTVNVPVAVTSHPNNVLVCPSANTSFGVTTSGAGATYQWQVNTGSSWSNVSNGGVYSNATTSTLSISGATASMNNYQYRCTVNGTCPPGATSNSATLTVGVPTSITNHPSSLNLCGPSSPSFSIAALGSNIQYEWYIRNTGTTTWIKISSPLVATGYNTNSITLVNGNPFANATRNQEVYCKAIGACGTSNSNIATLVINPKPAIVTHPTNKAICENGKTQFITSATGTSLTYQWQIRTSGGSWVDLTNSTTYTGVTTKHMYITSAPMSINNADFRCKVTGTCAPVVYSNSAKLTLTAVTTASVSVSATTSDICNGTSVTFTAAGINGGSSPTYQWKKNGVNVGSNSSTYTTNSLNNSDDVYCIFTSNKPCVNNITSPSNHIKMKVTQRVTPSISITSSSGNVECSGISVTFKAKVTNEGMSPIYQWRLNGQIVGGNVDSFVTSTLNDGDIVNCRLTSSIRCLTANNLTSNSIKMTINKTTKSSIVALPATDTIVCKGSPVALITYFTNGGTTPKYQWLRNGQPIPGETNATMNITSINNNDVIKCRFFSSALCVFPEDSKGITFKVNNPLTPSVDVTVRDLGNNKHIFTAIPTNGGNNPSFQWYAHGKKLVGETGISFTSTDFNASNEVYVEMTSSESCVSSSMASSRKITTGVGSITANFEEVGLFPNPNTGQFTIAGKLNKAITDKTVMVRVTNSLGATVHAQQYNASGKDLKLNINMSNKLASGLYNVNIMVDGEITTLRFMLSK